MKKAKPKIVSVVGARPQFIKLAALLRKLERSFNSRVVHTGQHFDREMSDEFFAEYKLRPPDVNLNIGKGTPARQLARMVDRLDAYLTKVEPDAVLVFGDTTSTTAGALAASMKNIPLGHVEAGLRSFDLQMAEEKNRVVTDHLSNWLFCPTREAVKNLRSEGIKKGIYPVGDLMAETFRPPGRFPRKAFANTGFKVPQPGEYYYVTLHRAEAVDHPEHLERLRQMLELLNAPVVFPVHPRTRNNLRRFELWTRLVHLPGIHLLPPVNHHTSLALIKYARVVLTDSGGVQKEAYWAGVQCLTCRTVTEWNLLVDAGWNHLVGFSPQKLRAALKKPFRPRKLTDSVFCRTDCSHAVVRQLRDDFA